MGAALQETADSGWPAAGFYTWNRLDIQKRVRKNQETVFRNFSFPAATAFKHNPAPYTMRKIAG